MTGPALPGGPRGAAAVEVPAQAKVNLRLRILARETSGYHQLETIFLRLDLADTIRVRRTSGARSLDVAGNVDAELLGPVERNLAWRAATEYFAASGMTGGFAIELEKRIPIGGGLGGGSADAGAVLRALDAMGTVALDWRSRAELAVALGADVPFLTGEFAYAIAWGRGERMLALAPLPARDVVLVVPPFGVQTADAFGWVANRAAVSEDGRAYAAPFTVEALSDWGAIAGIACNDFEAVVAERYPEIGGHVAALRAAGCEVAMLTGSGSTVFGVAGPSGAPKLIQPLPGVSDGTRYIHTRTAQRVEPVVVIE